MAKHSANDTVYKTIDDFPITTSLHNAAHEIFKHSFAIYKVPARHTDAIRQSWCEAVAVLNGPPPLPECQQIIEGHLYGYNIPSNAKILFRAFCTSPDQPWPNQSFQQASINVAEKLHELLVECYTNIEQLSLKEQQGEFLFSSLLDQEEHQPRRKRSRLTTSSRQSYWTIPPTIHDTTISPLDYFFYHNKGPDNSINCSEHVDRGVLICVCLTSVPGLEVLCRRSSSFVCPEVIAHNANLYQESKSCSGLICIMAGDQLSQLFPRSGIQPCVHRVRSNLKRSRLSISYELRI